MPELEENIIGAETTDETVETAEENQTVTDTGKKTEKVFKQEDVNRIIAREKANFRKEKESFETELADYQTQIEKLEGILGKMIADEKASLPEMYRAIIDKMPMLEQWEIVNDPKNKVSKKILPVTPKADAEGESKIKKLNKFI